MRHRVAVFFVLLNCFCDLQVTSQRTSESTAVDDSSTTASTSSQRLPWGMTGSKSSEETEPDAMTSMINDAQKARDPVETLGLSISNQGKYDFVCRVDSEADSGSGTLRMCIMQTNAVGSSTPGTTVLIFFAKKRMKGKLIELATSLPALVEGITHITFLGYGKGGDHTSGPTIRGPAESGFQIITALEPGVAITIYGMSIEGGEHGVHVGGPSPTLTIAKSSIVGAFSSGVMVQNVEAVRVWSSRVSGNGDGGMFAGPNVLSVHLRNSKFSDNAVSSGVDMSTTGSGELDIQGCTMNGNALHGLFGSNRIINEISSSIFNGNSGSGALLNSCTTSDTGYLADTHFNGNSWNGMTVIGSTIRVIKNVHASKNSRSGIWALGATDIGSVTESSFSGNRLDAMYIENSQLDLIRKVTLIGNGKAGIHVEDTGMIGEMRSTIMDKNEGGDIIWGQPSNLKTGREAAPSTSIRTG